MKTRTSFPQAVSRFRLTADDALPALKGLIICVAVSHLFYDSMFALPVTVPFFVLFVKKERELIRKNRIREIGMQFKDAILSALAAMKAGSSAENAFIDAGSDMAMLYGRESRICAELRTVAKGVMNSIPLEEMLFRLANRAENEDIREFADVFKIAKHSGGNMVGVITDTARVISERVEIENQISVITSAKRLEARLMEAVPLFIIFYVGSTSPGFFSPLYHNFFGYVFMSAALGIYMAAYLMTEKIINIDV